MHTTLILLPAIAYILLTLIFAQRAGVREIIEGLAKGHIVIFAFIAVSTEALSSIHEISFPAILNAWLLFLLVCFATATLLIKRRSQVFGFPALRRGTNLTAILVGTIIFILATTFVTATLYPPNNCDSMTYHMSRVVHWISNKSVSFYPTSITRQNYQMPLAEFAIMHLQILTGCDLYANLVQWMSFLVLICLSILIAAELGLSNRQQLISSVIIATLPMAILQATTTQNDLVVSSFIMSFALFMLRIRNNLSIENSLLTAIALGLALLTKGTAFLYCPAIGIALAIPVLLASITDRTQLIRVTAVFSLIIIIALLLNAGHFSRNYKLHGHLLVTSSEVTGYQNEDMSVATLLVNPARNAALHLGTPSRQINWYLRRVLQVAFGSELNNPKTTWPGESFMIPYSRHEDTAGNFIHMLIAFMCLMSLPVLWFQRHYRRTVWYTFGVILGAILYSWMFKWQPWASRLHTPLFALAAPLMAITITSDIGSVKKSIGNVIILLLVLYSIPFALKNSSRSLVSLEWYYNDRMQLYFKNRSNLFNDYNSAMNVLGKADNGVVGLYLGGDDYEYPFWAFAWRTKKNGRTISFRHVGVSNVSRTINEEVLLPSYVIATKSIETWEHAPKYVSVYTSESVSVFRKSGHNNALHTDGNPATLNSVR